MTTPNPPSPNEALRSLRWYKPTDHPCDREDAIWMAMGYGGRYAIEEYPDHFCLWMADDEFTFKVGDTVDACKAIAEQHWQDQIAQLFKTPKERGEVNCWVPAALSPSPASSPVGEGLISELTDALEDAKNNGFGEEFFRRAVNDLLARARAYPSVTERRSVGRLSKAVVSLVIAAREAWEVDCVSGDDLDKALEPFAALVPYENEPDREALSPSVEPAGNGREAVENAFIAGWEAQKAGRSFAAAMNDHIPALSSPPAADQEAVKCKRCNDTGWTIGNGTVREGCLSCDAQINMVRATPPAPALDGVRAAPVLLEWIIELARRDIMREQTDFIGRMHQAMGDFEFACEHWGNGEVDEASRDDAGEALADLAGLALAQLAMVNNPDDPLAALSSPSEGESAPASSGAGDAFQQKVKPWYEVDAHRDLSRLIPDMEGKIADAKKRFGHCLPDHLFAPLEASITELRVLRHELAVPSAEGRLREALTYYANDEHYDGGDVPGHIYVLDDHGRTARDALAHPSPAPQQPQSVEKLREALERIGWHELTAREARDIARTALEGRGS